MVIEHRITSTDTIRTLAQRYLNDSNRWQEIADFNTLNYPYIVEDDTARRNMLQGNGYIRVKRTNFRTARSILKGWQLHTEIDVFSGQQKFFEVTEDVAFRDGQQEAIVHVRALVKGVYGNLPVDTALVAGLGFTENGFPLNEAVTVERFTGGKDARVLTVGEYIYIPNDAQTTAFANWERVVGFVGGEDLALNENGDPYVDGFGDIASVQGSDNIIQAINHRLMTERGALRLHPEYGSGVHFLLGTEQSPYRLKLIELDIYETLSYEDRIQVVSITEIRVEGTAVYLTLEFRLQEVERVMSQALSLDYTERLPS